MDPDFEPNHFSRTAKRIYRNGHDKVGLMKWMLDSMKT